MEPLKPYQMKHSILLFLSDQHNAAVSSHAGHPVVETPHLDRLASEGTVFTDSVTPCPLCVPARVSFLSGYLPSRNGAFTNSAAIPEDHATWLHGLVAAGYQTVLCGRMHFVGEDQRHGFTDRIFSDFTPQFWQSGRKFNQDLGPYAGTLDASESTLKAVGGGGLSPVLAYDKAVVERARRYLEERKDERPLCLVVGTYGPHNPYVCSRELFEKYAPLADLPRAFGAASATDTVLTRARRLEMSQQTVRSVRAAYYGMVETLDAQIGAVRDAWDRFIDRNGSRGVFVYASDHGDHIGERNVLGKQTLLEPSVRIPMMFQGGGIPAGELRRDLASLLDLGPTFCALAGAPVPPRQDGRDLFAPGAAASERPVFSEFMDTLDGRPVFCRMIRQGPWKLVTHHGADIEDQLFNLERDPGECQNLAASEPALLRELRSRAWDDIDPEAVVDRHLEKRLHAELLVAAGDRMGPPETEVWSECRGCYQLPTTP